MENELEDVVAEAVTLDPLEGLEKLQGVEDRTVEIDIEDEDLIKAGERAAELHREMAVLEKQKKDTSKQLQGQIDNLKPEFNELMGIIDKGTHEQNLRCEKYYDKDANEICYVADGIVVDSREATEKDKQIDFTEGQEAISPFSVTIKKEDITIELAEAFELNITNEQEFLSDDEYDEASGNLLRTDSVQEDGVQQVIRLDDDNEIQFMSNWEEGDNVVIYEAETEEEKVKASIILKETREALAEL